MYNNLSTIIVLFVLTKQGMIDFCGVGGGPRDPVTRSEPGFARRRTRHRAYDCQPLAFVLPLALPLALRLGRQRLSPCLLIKRSQVVAQSTASLHVALTSSASVKRLPRRAGAASQRNCQGGQPAAQQPKGTAPVTKRPAVGLALGHYASGWCWGVS